jgi:hypothetical protein
LGYYRFEQENKLNEAIKKRRSLKEIREDMFKINNRRPSGEELITLVRTINESLVLDESEAKKITSEIINEGSP